MKRLFRRAKGEFDNIVANSSSQQHDQESNDLKETWRDHPSAMRDATALDILRYRYHHGTNLGSVYVLERWLTPSRFPDEASGSSEVEAVKAWVTKIGEEQTKRKFEAAWASAISDDDITWLKNDAMCTTIRLPIGYFDLPGESFTRGTPFQSFAYVYSSAWVSIRALISRLRSQSIGVLVDLHALPGGANQQEHSGTNSGISQFFTSKSYRTLGVRVCEFIASEANAGLEIVGIQLVNEVEWGSPGMYDWYDACLAAISAIDPNLPVVISDGWNLAKAVDYSLQKNVAYPSQPTCPLIIDTHFYWAFTDADKNKTPQQIIAEASTALSQLDGKEGSVMSRGAVQTIVGEYSCVLTEDSWVKAGSETSREDLVRQFGMCQSRRYQKRSAGAFFWTLKMDWMPGGEWGFKAQATPEPGTGARAISPPIYSEIPQHTISHLLDLSKQERDERMYTAVTQHVSYWDHAAPNMPAEHWRYEHGWKVGYQDAYRFFEGCASEAVAPGNKIGSMELWTLKRIRESGYRGNFVWEFEQGLRRGVQDFNSMIGI